MDADDSLRKEMSRSMEWEKQALATEYGPTHGLRTVLDPLPELHTGDLSRRGVLHEVVDRDAAIARDPSGAVRECAAVSAAARIGTSQRKREGGKG